MEQYDPTQVPDSAEWLALDEQERVDLVVYYHRKAQIELPNAHLHAIMHTIVENQIAEAHVPATGAMSRLIVEGLTRHDALHAVGSVLAQQMFALMRGESPAANPMASYDAALEQLSAKSWLQS